MAVRMSTFDGHDEHSRTSQRNISDELRAVDERLMAWGRWAKNDGYGVGWPAVTILGRVIEQGADGATQQGRPPISIPEPIAQVDAAVGKLDGTRRAIILVRYVLMPSVYAEGQRRKLGMSRHHWDTGLKSARIAIRDSLEAMALQSDLNS